MPSSRSWICGGGERRMRNGGKRGRTRRRRGRRVLLSLRGAPRRQRHIRLRVPLILLVPRFHGRKAALCGPHPLVPSFRLSRSRHRWICRIPRRRISMLSPAVRGAQRLREYARSSHRHFALGCHRSANTALLCNRLRCAHHSRRQIRRLRHLFGYGSDAVVNIRVAGARALYRVRVLHHL